MKLASPAEETIGQRPSSLAGRLQVWGAHWRALVVAGAVVVLYLPVIINLIDQWWVDPNYSHGFVVPLFSAYLLWERRRELAEIQPRPTSWGLAIVLGSLVMLFLGSLAAELTLPRVSLIGIIVGLLLFLQGWPLLKKVAFPLGVLLLMIPIPGVVYYQLVFPLQIIATKLAAGTLQALHLMPVLREGNILVLPSGRLEVAEACSGIRSLMSLLTIAVIYGHLAEKKQWIRVVLCLLIVPIAVLSNSVRVISAAIGAEYLGGAIVEGASHFLSGIVLFLIAMVMMIGGHALLRSATKMAERLRAPGRREAQ